MMAYEHLRTTLAEDLGVIPSAETEAVFDVLGAQGGSGREPSTRR